MTTAPHWYPLGRRVGVGADVDINALLAQQLDPGALNLVTPDVRNALAAGYSVVSSLAPAYSLINTLASGGVPDEQSTITALAGLATAINPLAGAAVLAAGELAQAFSQGAEELLKGLGLISDAPRPVPFVGLIEKGKPVPSGPNDSLWMQWDDFARWWYPSSGATDYAWYPGVLVGKPSMSQGPGGAVIQTIMHGLWTTSPNYHEHPGSSIATALIMDPQPSNAFEAFLLPVMKKNITYWANANPYVDPRLLLKAAVKAWNEVHPPSASDITYDPIEFGDNPTNTAWIELILGSAGDSSGNSQRSSGGGLPVQMGPAAPQVRTVSLHVKLPAADVAAAYAPTSGFAALSTPAKVAVVGASVTGAALVGTAIFAFAKGRAVDAVWKGIWKSVTRRR